MKQENVNYDNENEIVHVYLADLNGEPRLWLEQRGNDIALMDDGPGGFDDGIMTREQADGRAKTIMADWWIDMSEYYEEALFNAYLHEPRPALVRHIDLIGETWGQAKCDVVRRALGSRIRRWR